MAIPCGQIYGPSSSSGPAESSNTATTTSPDDVRLRLLTFLAIHDLLPYSVSHPPHGAEPLDIASVIDAQSFERCLRSMMTQGTLTREEARAFSNMYQELIRE